MKRSVDSTISIGFEVFQLVGESRLGDLSDIYCDHPCGLIRSLA